MTALTLVAHALTPALRGLVLGGAAEADAASLEAARELKLDADEVFVGPEPAAVRTAEAFGLTGRVESALRDREYGDWTGRSLEELLTAEPKQVADWLEHPHTAPPGGESANDVLTRVADWLGDLADAEAVGGEVAGGAGAGSGPNAGERPGSGAAVRSTGSGRRNVVAVVHPAVVRAAVLYALEAPAESLRHVDVRPLSVVHLSAHAGNWSLVFG